MRVCRTVIQEPERLVCKGAGWGVGAKATGLGVFRLESSEKEGRVREVSVGGNGG